MSTSTTAVMPVIEPRRDRATRLRAWLVSPGAGAAAICLAFLAITLWWVLTDVRDVNNDNGRHMLITNTWYEFIDRGDVLGPFREFFGYPPGVHLIGVATQALVGLKAWALVFTQNLVFVPLLALGTYGTAKIVFGRAAGFLAVLFVFGVPMLLSMFHVFMLDAPEAAMVAVTVWLLLLSNRFERPGIAALAGLAAAFGMYTKATFPVFVAGVIVVMLLRGGWRNWKGVLAFSVVLAALAGPYYVEHFEVLRGATVGLVGSGAGGEAGPPPWYGNIRFPARDEPRNYLWYPWSLLNQTLYVPLMLFFLAGLGWAIARLRTAAGRASPIPELLVGGAVGYLGVSMIIIKDPRYCLPCIVFIAVIGAAWITALPRGPRYVAATLLAAVVVFNTVTHNLGVGGAKIISTSKAIVGNPIGEYTFTVYRDDGYFEGPPVRTMAPFVQLLNDLHDKRGARAAVPHQPAFSAPPFSLLGTTILVKGSKLALPGFGSESVKSKTDAWIVRLPVDVIKVKPCMMTPGNPDGTGLYVYLGYVPANYSKVKPDCP